MSTSRNMSEQGRLLEHVYRALPASVGVRFIAPNTWELTRGFGESEAVGTIREFAWKCLNTLNEAGITTIVLSLSETETAVIQGENLVIPGSRSKIHYAVTVRRIEE